MAPKAAKSAPLKPDPAHESGQVPPVRLLRNLYKIYVVPKKSRYSLPVLCNPLGSFYIRYSSDEPKESRRLRGSCRKVIQSGTEFVNFTVILEVGQIEGMVHGKLYYKLVSGAAHSTKTFDDDSYFPLTLWFVKTPDWPPAESHSNDFSCLLKELSVQRMLLEQIASAGQKGVETEKKDKEKEKEKTSKSKETKDKKAEEKPVSCNDINSSYDRTSEISVEMTSPCNSLVFSTDDEEGVEDEGPKKKKNNKKKN